MNDMFFQIWKLQQLWLLVNSRYCKKSRTEAHDLRKENNGAAQVRTRDLQCVSLTVNFHKSFFFHVQLKISSEFYL
jgi:hypothetical protein